MPSDSEDSTADLPSDVEEDEARQDAARRGINQVQFFGNHIPPNEPAMLVPRFMNYIPLHEIEGHVHFPAVPPANLREAVNMVLPHLPLYPSPHNWHQQQQWAAQINDGPPRPLRQAILDALQNHRIQQGGIAANPGHVHHDVESDQDDDVIFEREVAHMSSSESSSSSSSSSSSDDEGNDGREAGNRVANQRPGDPELIDRINAMHMPLRHYDNGPLPGHDMVHLRHPPPQLQRERAAIGAGNGGELGMAREYDADGEDEAGPAEEENMVQVEAPRRSSRKRRVVNYSE